jgi:DNA-binding PadR family transcriptional regulator
MFRHDPIHDHLRFMRRMAEESARAFGPREPGAEEHRRHGRHHGGRSGGGGRDPESHRAERGTRARESRLFDHGDLRLVIMGLLAETPRYGYDIIKVLEERIGGGYSPSPGVVYPTLTLLEELGHATVASPEQSGRKLYTLTDAGRAVFDSQRKIYDAILARIAEAAAARRGPPPQIERAIDNLRTAIRLRLQGRPITEDQVRAVAAAIDGAAKAVEEI